MYQIRQFKPTLYTLLLLGMIGFAVAAQSMVALALGCGGVLINGWLVYTGRFRPLPRLIANIVTITALFVVVRQLTVKGGSSALDPTGNPVLIIGHFLVALQLVKLWEQRLNRDYGQLLVLSLLLVVAAAINTNLLAFGLLLVAYLFLSLYCCLLFHLKVETDRARETAQPASVSTREPAAKPASTPLIQLATTAMPRDEERQMVRSMRRMAGVVAVYALVTAVITFLFFPRNTGGGILSQAQFARTLAQTGYSEGLSLEPYSSLQSDDTPIAHARVTRNGVELGAGSTIYLRGISMNWYQSVRSRGLFKRLAADSQAMSVPGETEINVRHNRRMNSPRASSIPPPDAGVNTFTQSLVLSPTGTHVLFFVTATGASGQRSAMPFSFYANRDLRLKLGEDGAVQTEDPLTTPIEYEGSSDDRVTVVIRDYSLRGGALPEMRGLTPDSLEPDFTREASTARPGVPSIPAGTPAVRVTTRGPYGLQPGDEIVAVDGKPLSQLPDDLRDDEASAAHQAARQLTVVHQGNSLTVPYIPPEVAEYARRPDVSGTNEKGPLAAQRDRAHYPDPLDEEIARNIERHLRSQFTYTMDISDAKTRADLDPIVWFLSEDGRRGHCEYFAAAMTLMCQSLGIEARVVSGYRCDEYNDFSHRFIVKQSQAHAWVEVLTSDGWRTFDPTSGRDSSAGRTDSSLWQRMKHLFDWLESSYANHILYYNNDSRDNLIQSMESQMTKPLYKAVNEGWITARWKDSKIYQMFRDPTKGPVPWIIAAVVLAVAVWYGRRIWKRWKLRQRAERIGLDALPAAERIRLARQLGFYDDLLRMLEKRRIYRKAHQTPLEFARSLLYLPADAYEAILRLTSIFYRVRFGQQSLNIGLQKRLQTVITRLDGELSAG
jgi:transglutaminase-like putative cysteine protease